jgi:hypothetical protein
MISAKLVDFTSVDALREQSLGAWSEGLAAAVLDPFLSKSVRLPIVELMCMICD